MAEKECKDEWEYEKAVKCIVCGNLVYDGTEKREGWIHNIYTGGARADLQDQVAICCDECALTLIELADRYRVDMIRKGEKQKSINNHQEYKLNQLLENPDFRKILKRFINDEEEPL